MSKIEITDEMVDRAGNVLVLSGKLHGDWHDVVRGALNAALSPPVYRAGPDTRWGAERRVGSLRPKNERGQYYRTTHDEISFDTRKAQRRTGTPKEERRKATPERRSDKCAHSWVVCDYSEKPLTPEYDCIDCGARKPRLERRTAVTKRSVCAHEWVMRGSGVFGFDGPEEITAEWSCGKCGEKMPQEGEGARLMPRTCLEYGPIEMPDGTFQHRRRSDGENGLRDVVHNRSDDKRKAVSAPSGAEETESCGRCFGAGKEFVLGRVGDGKNCWQCGGTGRVSATKPDVGILTSPTTIPVSEDVLNAGVAAMYGVGGRLMHVLQRDSTCVDHYEIPKNEGLAAVYRAMRAKEIEETTTARRVWRREGDPK